MLVPDTLLQQQNSSVVDKATPSVGVKPRRCRLTKKIDHSSQNIQLKSNVKKNDPFWLKSLMIFSKGSSVFCGLSVAVAFVMYGMTVYAPKIWTNKYHHLQELQKQERQFTFTDEILKNQLAESAKQSNSGLVNPDPTKPPLFLPETTPKTIELNQSPEPKPKEIEKISPIAY